MLTRTPATLDFGVANTPMTCVMAYWGTGTGKARSGVKRILKMICLELFGKQNLKNGLYAILIAKAGFLSILKCMPMAHSTS